jgi:hypothetical protein
VHGLCAFLEEEVIDRNVGPLREYDSDEENSDEEEDDNKFYHH